MYIPSLPGTQLTLITFSSFQSNEVLPSWGGGGFLGFNRSVNLHTCHPSAVATWVRRPISIDVLHQVHCVTRLPSHRQLHCPNTSPVFNLTHQLLNWILGNMVTRHCPHKGIQDFHWAWTHVLFSNFFSCSRL